MFCGLYTNSRCAGVKLLPESSFSKVLCRYAKLRAQTAHNASHSLWPRLSAVCTSLGLQRPHGGHPHKAACEGKRGTSLRCAGSARRIGGSSDSWGPHAGPHAALRAPCQVTTQTRVSARAHHESEHDTKIGTCRRARSTPSSGGLPQRRGAPRSSGAARRGRVARGTAVSNSAPHAIDATSHPHRTNPGTTGQDHTLINRALPYARRPHFCRGGLPQGLVQFRRRLLVELRLVVHALQDGDDVRLEHHAGHHDLVQDVVDLVAVEN